MSTLPIAIVGAGLAGLGCAARLHAAGRAVVLFDKGRAPGGRLATRRVETPHGLAQFDHGAQYFTVRNPDFASLLAHKAADAAAPWPAGPPGAYVGVPGMSGLARALARGLDVRLSTRVSSIRSAGDRLSLTLEDGGEVGDFGAVVVATPAEQAGAVLRPLAPGLADEADAAVTAPCWAGLFAFPAGSALAPFASLEDDPVLAWIAAETEKPGRPDALRCVVVHARADWSRAHLERAPEEIAPLLARALAERTGLIAPMVAQAHRWRFAKVERAAEGAFGWDPAVRIGTCGDWRLGARVESAWASGHALAEAILS